MFVQRRLLRLAVRTAPGPLALTCLLGLLGTAAGVITGFAVAEAVRRVLAGAAVVELTGPIALAVTAVAARGLTGWARDVAAHHCAGVVKVALRQRLTAHVLALGPGYTTGHRAGDVQATLADGVENLQAYVGFYLPQAAVAVIAPVVLVTGMFVLDPVVGGAVLAATLVVPIARPLFSRVLGDRGREHWDAYRELAARMLDALQGVTTLKLLGASERHGRELEAATTRLYQATVNNLGVSLVVYSIISIAMGVGTAVATGVGALRLATGALDAGALLVVLFLAAECFRPLLELQNYWHEGFHGVAAGSGIFGLLDTVPDVRDAGRRTRPAHPGPAEVRFQDVSVVYPGAERPAIDRIDVVVTPGSTVAVVGRSGAGKSTLVAVLLRHLDPTTGRVLVDGVDLREFPLAEARRLSSVVSQDVHLFHGTIADNLRLAAPHATDGQLRQAIDDAHLGAFVDAAPAGLATVVGERGATLSGGERQRIAIARALLKDAPLLVLDEATSSIDGASEAAIQAALERVREGRTTVIVAHRLSTIRDADQVVVLDAGRVIEAGRPDELLAADDGAFRRLVDAQASGVRGGTA